MGRTATQTQTVLSTASHRMPLVQNMGAPSSLTRCPTPSSSIFASLNGRTRKMAFFSTWATSTAKKPSIRQWNLEASDASRQQADCTETWNTKPICCVPAPCRKQHNNYGRLILLLVQTTHLNLGKRYYNASGFARLHPRCRCPSPAALGGLFWSPVSCLKYA